MLLCNPELDPPTPCWIPSGLDGYDCLQWQVLQFSTTPPTVGCYNFPGWRNIYGTPDFSYINSTPTDDTQIRMWATNNKVGEPAECCQRGEGIMAEVNIQSGTPYIVSYLRRILLYCDPGGGGDLIGDGSEFLMPPDECVGTNSGFPSTYASQLDNLYIKLTDWDEITWPHDHYLQPQPANFETVLHETNISSTNWEKVFQCFTPTDDWNTFYIYPQQEGECNDLIFAYIDQVHLIEDDFMDITDSFTPTCQEAIDGIDMGWHCNEMTDLQYTWEYSLNFGATWVPMAETDPFITVFPLQSTWYRISRTLATNPNYSVVLGSESSNCIDASVIITVEIPNDCIIPCVEGATFIGSEVGIPTATDANILGLLSDPVLYVIGDFTIDQNVIFSSQTINMHSGAEIIVPVSNTLFIEDTHILGVCNMLWKQIQVFGELTVIDNSLIEDGHYAVRAEHNSKIHISETTFNKCFIGVFVPPATSGTNFISWLSYSTIYNLTGCTFTCPIAQNLLMPYPGAVSFPNTIGSRPWAGIAVYDLQNDLLVGNNDTGNLPNFFENLSKGAYFIRCARIYITNSDFDNIKPPSPAYDSQDGRAISLINNAVVPGWLYVKGLDGTPGMGPVNITDCKNGIYAQQVSVVINSCFIDLIEIAIAVRGASNGFVNVYENEIYHCSVIGISMSVNSNTYHYINKNQISMIGSQNSGGAYIGTGIEINGCTGVPDVFESEVSENNVLVGERAIRGINVISTRNINLISNTIQTETPGAPMLLPPIERQGINISGSTTFSVNCNSVSSTTAPNLNVATGLQVASSTDIDYSENVFFHTLVGAKFSGTCTNTQLRGTLFNDHYFALWLTSSANLGVQTHLGNTWLNSAAYTYTTIAALGTSASVRHDGTTLAQVALSRFHVNTSALPLYPPTPHRLQAGIVIIDWFTIDPLGCTWGTSGCPGEEFSCTDTGERPERQMALNEFEEQIAADSIAVSVWEPELNRTADKELYDKLKTYPHLLADNAAATQFVAQKDADIDGTFQQILSNSRNALAADSATIAQREAYMGQLSTLYEQINALNTALAETGADTTSINAQLILLYNTANQTNGQLLALAQNFAATAHSAIDALSAQNAQINWTNQYEQNEKEVNGIYFQTVAKGIFEFSPQQIADIAAIANQCPLSGGNAVYRARSLYALITEATYNDEAACAEQGMQYKNSPVPVRVSMLTFVPNPATSEVTMQIATNMATDTGVAEVYNLMGERVHTYRLNTTQNSYSLSVNDLPPGLYMVRVQWNHQPALYGKLTVIR